MPKVMKKPYKKTYRKRRIAKNSIVSKIRKEIALDKKKHTETKTSCFSTANGIEIYHNNFLSLDNHPLKTTQGFQDPTTIDTSNRIGDKITVKGLSIKFMIQMNTRYSDVTYRLLIIRSAKGDTPTTATLFNGLSANKMLDTLNKERYSVIYQKYYKLISRNQSIVTPSGLAGEVGTTVPPSNAGIQYAYYEHNAASAATKICKVWIPGSRFARNGVIQYENGTSQVKFFDYHVMIYVYSNYGTYADWYVARVDDYISQLYFTDA